MISLERSANRRPALTAGAGFLVALAALLPMTASANIASPIPALTGVVRGVSSPPTTVTSVVRGVSSTIPAVTGVVSGVSSPLTARGVVPGDYVSSGWAIRMAGTHPAAVVTLTKIVATIPLTCRTPHQRPSAVNLVLQMPDARVGLPANDTTWHPTANPAVAAGYQASALVGNLCAGGVLTRSGNSSYTAHLVSADTRDPFTMRFHTVDASSNPLLRGVRPAATINCASLSVNGAGLLQCKAAWTRRATSLATAVASGTGPGSVIRRVSHVVAVPHVVRTVLRHAQAVAGGTVAQASSGTSASTSAPPSLALRGSSAPPAPRVATQSPALGPVPVQVPAIDGVAAGVAGALPWNWFLLLAALDVGLIVTVMVRRRSAQRDRLRAR
jgi:hypothetical protein